MSEENETSVDRSELLALTSGIVSSHVANNSVAMADLPALIEHVFGTLSKLGSASTEEVVEKLKPVVPIRRSITPDYIICLEDGKKLKMLKRHLRTAYGLSPEDYREKWGLPGDYPMVAPNYAAQRRTLAKKIGLGTKRAGRKK
ncbi:MAG: MucR family transcriptional regulator [Proteobacteria bacterium]|jgi:predicted transcriptional regulator|nr:MucR family transcriptional regulator [Pseudomonadota bacterium]